MLSRSEPQADDAVPHVFQYTRLSIVRHTPRLYDASDQVEQEGIGMMPGYNLTQHECQVLVRLFELSQHSDEDFEAEIIDMAATGPSGGLARLDFGGNGHAMELTTRDLRTLKHEGFIHFRWDLPDRGTGRLTSRALAALLSGGDTRNGYPHVRTFVRFF
jgi:hypothetical protein